MALPLISVIIPLYNSEIHIAETLNCIYNQTYTNIEVIVIDDGSTDNSYEVANQLKKENTIIVRQQNKGASAARNAGLRIANGKYVQFLDADDLISEDKIQIQVTAIKNDLSKLAVCSAIHFADGTLPEQSLPSPYEETFLFSDPNPVHFLINLMGGYSKGGSMVPIHAWLVSKETIKLSGKWDEALGMDDDGEYFCRVILSAGGIIKTEGFCYYRRSPINCSLSSQTNLRSYESMLKSYMLRKKHLLNRSDSYEANVAVYKLFMNLAVGSYNQYPEISKLALAEVPKIHVTGYFPSVGGFMSTKLAQIFGWQSIKRLQYFYYNLKFDKKK